MTRRWRRMILLATAVVAVAVSLDAQSPQPNTLTPAEQKDGWKLLFDGKTIDKWRGFKRESMPENWTVVDGAITLTTPRRAVDIISVEQFGDFDFKFDWQLAPAPPAGNSGVMFYVTEEGGQTYHTGPEYQVLDNATHADGKNPLTSAGSCYALYAPSKDVTRPVGEWNESRIVLNRGRGEHWLNGVKVVEFDMNSDEWKAKVLGSKFKEWPGFGVARRGHLAIQQHGARVAYRNLKIKTLN